MPQSSSRASSSRSARSRPRMSSRSRDRLDTGLSSSRRTTLSLHEKNAVAMLIDEVEKRTQIRWQVAKEWPQAGGPRSSWWAENPIWRRDYPRTNGWWKYCPPHPARRVIGSRHPNQRRYSSSEMIREACCSASGGCCANFECLAARFWLPAGFEEATAPQSPLRGHQLGYRPEDEFL